MRALLVSTLLLLVGSGSLACDAYEATTSGAESAPPAVAGRETTAPSPAEPAYAVVSWEDARDVIGEVVTVEGPVADTLYDTASAGGPTILIVGREPTDPKRLAIVIWAADGEGFPQAPEELYADHTIRVTGRVEAHEGMLRIEVTSPEPIEIVD
jgi:RecJ-like exonuclease